MSIIRRLARIKKGAVSLVVAAGLLGLMCACGRQETETDKQTGQNQVGQTQTGLEATDGQGPAGETGSQDQNQADSSATTTDSTNTNTEEKEPMIEPITDYAMSLKVRGNTNPIMTQAFGADPFAMVYDDTIYIYMTADAFEYDSKGLIKENTYSSIRSIHVVSTKDMKNFTDHGEIPVAGKDGIAKWAHNSWAPAAAWKTIDGKDKFFLYFADNGGGIGVISADSPVGPFEDPLGHALISRSTPECADVLWLFDPAVLVDDDGTGYIYFGGGVPQGKEAHPGTGRAAKLGPDMISIEGTPVRLDPPYLFEDSGIHKYNGRYYYSYCTNWNVDPEGAKEYGFQNGEIAYMVSDSPLGPFTYAGKFLENPGKLCGLYGNNHHAVFSYHDKLYVVYHSRLLEKNIGIEKGYRATFIDRVKMNEDGTIAKVEQTKEGPKQLALLDPYQETPAVMATQMAGVGAVVGPDSYGEGLEHYYGSLELGDMDTGAYLELTGVDFGDEGATKLTVIAEVPEDVTGAIYVRLDFLKGDNKCELVLTGSKDGKKTYTANLTEPIKGEHYLYFVYSGSGYTISSWKFEK